MESWSSVLYWLAQLRSPGPRARRRQISQARADLTEILADTADRLQRAEAGVALEAPRPGGVGAYAAGTWSVTLAAGAARLRIDLWDQGRYGPIPGHAMIMAGMVVIARRRSDTEVNAANLVYEQAGDQPGWQVYRFRQDMGAPADDRPGFRGPARGLSYSEFFDRAGRYFAGTSGQAWQTDVMRLTSTTLLDLFREAVQL